MVMAAAFSTLIMALSAVAQTAEPPATTQGKMISGAKPVFDVAAITLSNPSNTQHGGFNVEGRTVTIDNQRLVDLISFAYGIHTNQIVNGPSWFATDRYDIRGVPNIDGEPSLMQLREMISSLLATRFMLKQHYEKRPLRVYVLSVSRGGPKLTVSSSDPRDLLHQNTKQFKTQMAMTFNNASVADFVLVMQLYDPRLTGLDRPIVNQTGLIAKYDFRLKWTFDDSTPSDSDSPPGLFTAVKEQLGLKFDPTKATADVLVVDHVERPSAN